MLLARASARRLAVILLAAIGCIGCQPPTEPPPDGDAPAGDASIADAGSPDAGVTTEDAGPLEWHLDLPPWVSVSGTLLTNGAPPAETACAAGVDETASVTFVNQSTDARYTSRLRCGSGFRFEGLSLPIGSYDVWVDGRASNVPLARAARDVLVTADVEDMVVDVPGLDVHGYLTVDGARAVDERCASASVYAALIQFIDEVQGYVRNVDVPCGTGVAFGPVTLAPGTYDVIITGSRSNVPSPRYLARRALVIDRAMELVLDAPTVSASGTISFRGAPPTTTCAGAVGVATIHWIDPAQDYETLTVVPCDASPVFGPARLYRGTYDVYVEGSGGRSDLPNGWSLAAEGVEITTDTAGLSFDVRTVEVFGNVLFRGITVPELPSCSMDIGSVRLTSHTSVSTTDVIPVHCGAGGAFFGEVVPGTYDVFFLGGFDGSLVANRRTPPAEVVLVESSTNVDVDVPAPIRVTGAVRWNGAAPLETTACTDSLASIRFERIDGDQTSIIPIDCGGGAAFDSSAEPYSNLWPGTFHVSVWPEEGSSDLFGTYLDAGEVTLDGSTSGLVVDLTGRRVSGTLRVGGVEPTETDACAEGSDVATVQLILGGARYSIPIRCGSGFAFEVEGAPPGTYTVVVEAVAGRSDLPARSTVGALVIP